MEVELPVRCSNTDQDSSSLESVSIEVDCPIATNQEETTSMDVGVQLETSAVEVINVHLSFGSVHVLADLCMQLPRGSIYGLLGPSGCGKTSLIRCLLGSLHTTSGSIEVFGQRPGCSRSMVPGPGVGYMPQDISLYPVLTIAETLHYFGSLYNMGKQQRSQQIDFLVNFLELPDRERRVGVLSGGQKRRVSLATALIHKPPLLILDEPTVGVDPLLRRTIWEHLIKLSVQDRLTVLITTHYIEEAKDANLVGLMRNGRILEQDSPAALLERYHCHTLELVFLHVCQNDALNSDVDISIQSRVEAPKPVESTNTISSRDSSSSSSGVDTGEEDAGSNSSRQEQQPALKVPSKKEKAAKHSKAPKRQATNPIYQMGALSYKNFISLFRNPGYMLFQFLLPTLEVILFCLCIGLKLHSIPVAVFDGDHSDLSHQFLGSLNPATINQQFFNSSTDAIEAVRNGKASTALILNANFSSCLQQRLLMFGEVEPDVLHNSTIHLHPDMSNQLMVISVHNEVLRSFIEVAKRYLADQGFSSKMLDMPVSMEEPIYGHPDPPYTEFMAPGVILSITFLAAIPLTTMSLVVERKDGLIERTVVAGVSHFCILVSHLITQTLILLVQVLLLMLVVFPVFRIPYHGEFIPIMILTISQSFCGLSFGLLVSAISDTENTATMLSLGAFYPMLLLSGTVWPINAMGEYLQYFALILPQTIPILSMRDMIARGWSVTSWSVLKGFLVSYIWIIAFLFLATLIFRRHN